MERKLKEEYDAYNPRKISKQDTNSLLSIL